MADELVKNYGSWLLLVVFLGSLVDLFQFSWIVKRQWKRYERSRTARIRAQVIAELHDETRR